MQFMRSTETQIKIIGKCVSRGEMPLFLERRKMKREYTSIGFNIASGIYLLSAIWTYFVMGDKQLYLLELQTSLLFVVTGKLYVPTEEIVSKREN